MRLRVALIMISILLCCGILYSEDVITFSYSAAKGETEVTLNGIQTQPDDPLIGDLDSGWYVYDVTIGPNYIVVRCRRGGSGCGITIEEINQLLLLMQS